MSILQCDMIEDFVLLNEMFSIKLGISERDSFNYLKNYGGVDFYEKHYAFEHTQSYESTVNRLVKICRQNGGTL
jgi:hypothetical protein